MKLFNIITHSGIAAAVAFAMNQPAIADTLEITTLAPGYLAHSIELGVGFGGAIAQHPADENILYASVGPYSMHSILEVQLDTGTTRTVTPVVGNVGGLAVLANGDLAITDNDDFTSDTILRARDLNADGDWLDAGEITELIAPILTNGSFTGAQLTVAPAGNQAGIPAGSLLVQTADGGTNSEILVIQNPESNPAYYPSGAAWFSGFNYNGGLAFTPEGHVVCGISEFPAGRVAALVNTNADDNIDAGEFNDIVTTSQLTNSISDLGTTGDGKLITSENGGTIRMFQLPDNLLAGTATGTVLAETNAGYVSSARVDFPARPFTRGAASPLATVYIGGFVTFPAATNLLAITPKTGPSSAAGWELFD